MDARTSLRGSSEHHRLLDGEVSHNARCDLRALLNQGKVPVKVLGKRSLIPHDKRHHVDVKWSPILGKLNL
jgi:hypothetical protein